MSAVEVNFDGLVGLTHNYSGLSEGNIASAKNKDAVAYPRKAALQGLAKMKKLAALGLVQGVLPPQERPFIPALHALGFNGTDAEIWERAWRDEPRIARNVAAASAMWAANAATVSPSADCADQRVHITPANLHTMLHRALEAASTTRLLKRIFHDETRFEMHAPLPSQSSFADEGAANHMRLCAEHGEPGVEVFVYSRTAEETDSRFPARQTLEACRAIARRHDLSVEKTIFARQSREAIDAGAFHNDVVAVANETSLFFHEQAFAEKEMLLGEIRRQSEGSFEPNFVEVPASAVPLSDAVSSYLFNAQLLHLPGDARLTLLLPEEARENARTKVYLDDLIRANGPIGRLEFIDVRESMRNGGGPACLRLRVVLTDVEQAAARQGFFLTDALAAQLEAWIQKHYREQIAPDDLADPHLIEEMHSALDALTNILPLGSDFYDFQR